MVHSFKFKLNVIKNDCIECVPAKLVISLMIISIEAARLKNESKQGQCLIEHSGGDILRLMDFIHK